MAETGLIADVRVRGADQARRELQDVGEAGERALKRLDTATRQPSLGLKALSAVSGELHDKMGDLSGRAGTFGGVLERLGPNGMIAAAGIGALVVAITGAGAKMLATADSARAIKNSLELVTGSSQEAEEVFLGLQSIAAETGTGMEALKDVFFRMTAAQKDLGLSRDEILSTTSALAKLNSMSGETGAGAAGAMMQLGQAFASSRVQAEEFNSVAEGLPALMQLFADHIEGAGGSVGKLKEMVKDGQIAGRDLAQVLIRNAEEIESKYQEMPKTVATAWAGLLETLGAFVTDADKATGSTSFLSAEIDKLKKNVLGLRDDFSGLLTLLSSDISDSIFNQLLVQNMTILGPLSQVVNLVAKLNQLRKQGGATGSWGDEAPDAGAGAGATGSWGDGDKPPVKLPSPQPRSAESPRTGMVTPTGPGKEDSAGKKSRGGKSDAEKAADQLKKELDALDKLRQAHDDSNGNIIRSLEARRSRELREVDASIKDARRLAEARELINSTFNQQVEKADREKNDRLSQAAKELAEQLERIDADITAQQIASLRARGDASAAAQMDLASRYEQIETGGGTIEQQDTLKDLARRDIGRVDAYEGELAARREALSLAELELSLMDESVTKRSELVTAAREDLELRRQFPLATEDEIEAMQQLAVATARARAEIAESEEAQRDFRQIARQGISDIIVGFEEALINAEKFDDVLNGVATSIQRIALNLANRQLERGLDKLLQVGIGALGNMFAGGVAGGAGGAGSYGAGSSGYQTGAVGTQYGGFGFAKGGVFSAGNVVPFARGGVVDRPVVFPMARGMGLMGEAGPEAVVPLRRLPSGDLGVQSSSGKTEVNVIVNNNAPAQVQTERKDNGRGGVDIMMTIDPLVAGAVSQPGSMTRRALMSDDRGPRR